MLSQAICLAIFLSCPPTLKSGGTRPPRPPPIDARADIPNFLLNGETLPRVSKNKYFGHIFIVCIEDLCDNDDISRQYKRIYAQVNALIRKFDTCTESVRCTLFKSYCTSLYTCQLWCCYRAQSMSGKLFAAYNNVFRFVCNEPRDCSASYMFVSRGLPGHM